MAGKSKPPEQTAVAVSSGESAAGVVSTEKATEQNKRPGVPGTRFIYIGPSLPHGVLNRNSVFMGDWDKVTGSLSGPIEKYPQIKKLLVPVSQLAASRTKLETGGNILSKAFAEVSAALSMKED